MVVGILGGMGTYATVDFFKRLADSFPAEKEWERPRMIIDNHCTMPSRVRALLYGERRKELVDDLVGSIDLLLQGGATDVILACNTSHCFLDDVYRLRPEFRKYVIHIIELCAKKLSERKIGEVYLIATEGTIETGIYDQYLSRYGIRASLPAQNELVLIRNFIEAVKQNNITDDALREFGCFLNDVKNEHIILGCTEIPVIYGRLKEKPAKMVYDPLQFAIDELKLKFGLEILGGQA
ncbi:MAG: aspartate/glutamate racemase family protein [Clostridia bacterium]|jgi:aspartate racemase|nr:aspartate/glutamate racemase family protein [Clostridia bacterium]